MFWMASIDLSFLLSCAFGGRGKPAVNAWTVSPRISRLLPCRILNRIDEVNPGRNAFSVCPDLSTMPKIVYREIPTIWWITTTIPLGVPILVIWSADYLLERPETVPVFLSRSFSYRDLDEHSLVLKGWGGRIFLKRMRKGRTQSDSFPWDLHASLDLSQKDTVSRVIFSEN